MEDVFVRYPTVEYRTYRPGSKGLNIHYKGYREGPYGMKGKLRTRMKDYHRTTAVSGYVDQRGVNTFAYKIPDAKQHRAAPFMDRLPRGGLVPRIVGSIGDVENSFVDPNPAIAAAIAAAAKTNVAGTVPTPAKAEDTLTLFQPESNQSFNQPTVNDPKPFSAPAKFENIVNPQVESSHNSIYASASSLGYETAPQAAASSQYFDDSGGGDGGLYGDDNAFNYGLPVDKGKGRIAEPTTGNPANNANNLYFLDPRIIAENKNANLYEYFGQNDVQDGPDPSRIEIVTNGPKRRSSQPDASNSGVKSHLPTPPSSNGSSPTESVGSVGSHLGPAGWGNISKDHVIATSSLQQRSKLQLQQYLNYRHVEFDKNATREELLQLVINYYHMKWKGRKTMKARPHDRTLFQEWDTVYNCFY